MTTENSYTIVDVDSPNELLKYRDGIFCLFEKSFNQLLKKELWEWAYINNPFGSPKVSLAIHDGVVVGHYAVIPLKLKNEQGCLSAYLSMTTMVAPEYRRYRLFQCLAERVYQRISALGEPSVVIGFPNDNSVPGFKKRLGWTVLEQYAVVKMKLGQELKVKDIIQNTFEKNAYKLDLSDKAAKSWRLNKPGQGWNIVDGVGIKFNSHGVDMMYVESLDHFEERISKQELNVILPVVADEFEVSFPYRFGYRGFNLTSEPEFFVEMCMSDVF